MNSQDCFRHLEDLFAHYSMQDDVRASWGAVVYKACAKMEADHFAEVCAALFERAGKFRPTNDEFWATFHRLKAENGWEDKTGKKCPSCNGNGTVGGCWIARLDWRTMEPFPMMASEAFQDSSKPCGCDQSEGATRWRQSYYAATSRGWTELTMEDWGAELRAWQAERKARAASAPTVVVAAMTVQDDEEPPFGAEEEV